MLKKKKNANTLFEESTQKIDAVSEVEFVH